MMELMIVQMVQMSQLTTKAIGSLVIMVNEYSNAVGQ